MTYFVSITDDKDRGWAAPSDDSGKMFTYTRLWACDPQDSTPTYDQAEHFLQFLDILDDQDENLSAQEEECAESNEDDWKMDVDDGDGNDDIPKETVIDDDEEGRPRNSLRIC